MVLVVRRAECKTLDGYQCVVNRVEWLEAAAGRAVCGLGKLWQGSAASTNGLEHAFLARISALY
jgi:hypothetical protein